MTLIHWNIHLYNLLFLTPVSPEPANPPMSMTVPNDDGLDDQLPRNRVGTQRNKGLMGKEYETQRRTYIEKIIKESGY